MTSVDYFLTYPQHFTWIIWKRNRSFEVIKSKKQIKNQKKFHSFRNKIDRLWHLYENVTDDRPRRLSDFNGNNSLLFGWHCRSRIRPSRRKTGYILQIEMRSDDCESHDARTNSSKFLFSPLDLTNFYHIRHLLYEIAYRSWRIFASFNHIL